MPAVITHYLFGKDVYQRTQPDPFEGADEFSAFMLGCQGPDVLFYSALSPKQLSAATIGSDMHKADPMRLFRSLQDAANMLPEDIRGIGQAYVQGFFCHYLLDSTLHPLIYAQQNALTNAGVDGLDERDGHEVHAEIESELDVLALSTKEGITISSLDPLLPLFASERCVQVISLLCKYVAKNALGKDIRHDAFESGVNNYRVILFGLRSPKGIKRKVMGVVERRFRRHSFVQAMSHKNQLISHSIFDNRTHDPWTDPETGQMRTEGFWDLYDRALGTALEELPNILSASEDDLLRLTGGLDFNGTPTRPLILAVS